MNSNPQPIANPAPRVPFPQRVWIRTENQNEAHETWGVNISETGMFLQTVDPPRIGSPVRVRFQIDGEDGLPRLIEAMVEVIWIKRFEPINVDGILPGMGGKFLIMDEQTRLLIRKFVAIQSPTNSVNKTALSAPKNATDESSANIRFEQEMFLQIMGGDKPIAGYSTELSEDGLRFCSEVFPKDRCPEELKSAQPQKPQRGLLVIPVKISQTQRRVDGQKNTFEFDFDLRFQEPEGDLVRSLLKLPKNLMQVKRQDTATGPAAKKTEKDDPKKPPAPMKNLLSRILLRK